METMPKPPGLQKRRHRFYLRVAVPHDIRGALNKTEIIRPLKTADYKEAVRRLPLERAKVDAEFERARRDLARGPITELDHHSIQQLALLWFQEAELGALNAEAVEQSNLPRGEALLGMEQDVSILADANDPNVEASVQAAARRVMKRNNVALSPDSHSYRQLCDLIRRGMLEGVRRSQDRFQGDYSLKSHDAMFQAVGGSDGGNQPQPLKEPQTTLERLLESFLTDPTRTAGSKADSDYRVVLRFLNEFVPAQTPVQDVRRDHCRKVVELLTRMPSNASKHKVLRNLSATEAAHVAEKNGLPAMSATTANSYIGKMSALFRWAVREGLIDSNPAEGLQLPETTSMSEKRLPFSSEQLSRIFQSDIYHEAKNFWDHRQWIPLIGLYAGLRLNEICTLRCDDIIEKDGVLVIWVRPDASGQKKLKSKSAKRAVPVHRTLVDIGFMNYVECQRSHGHTALFPDMKPDRRGYYSDAYQKWFARHLEKIGAKTEKTSFHSLRHCFRDQLREATAPHDVVDALGGWKSRTSVADVYGSGLRASTLKNWIDKIAYPEVSL